MYSLADKCNGLVVYLQVYPRVSQMAAVTEQKGPSGRDHRGHGQRKQEDSVQEHRGMLARKHTNTHTRSYCVQT